VKQQFLRAPPEAGKGSQGGQKPPQKLGRAITPMKGVRMTDEITQRTQDTAKRLFSGGVKMSPPYLLWKAFDRDLANDFSRFITGNLYSRTVLSLPERQMVACAALAAIRAGDELRLHVNAALNVGCDPRKLAEVFFQVGTYAGMPAVNEALDVYRDVLTERGEWPIRK
jgi:4-carboxymuconolactone decarboxylase